MRTLTSARKKEESAGENRRACRGLAPKPVGVYPPTFASARNELFSCAFRDRVFVSAEDTAGQGFFFPLRCPGLPQKLAAASWAVGERGRGTEKVLHASSGRGGGGCVRALLQLLSIRGPTRQRQDPDYANEAPPVQLIRRPAAAKSWTAAAFPDTAAAERKLCPDRQSLGPDRNSLSSPFFVLSFEL